MQYMLYFHCESAPPQSSAFVAYLIAFHSIIDTKYLATYECGTTGSQTSSLEDLERQLVKDILPIFRKTWCFPTVVGD